MRIRAVAIFAGLWACTGALAQSPLSAIDWLSDSLATQEVVTLPTHEPAVRGGAITEVITVTPLDEISSDAVGLLPISITGLPRSLWGKTPSVELADSLVRLDTQLVPALQDLLFTLLLAELDPPTDSDPTAGLFVARIDTLLALGAVEQALALLNRAGSHKAVLFRRWFDASLLNGTEDAACARLRANPDLSPTLPVRIFCLARGGDWDAAALTLETGRALGDLDQSQEALLTRFLDVDGLDDALPLTPPLRPTPLEFRMLEAIGESMPTTNLPLAFAHADLGSNGGWKAQIIAAERLARSGAIAENQLLGLYTERLPAASGGVWDRVAAIQRLDIALASRDPDVVGAALPDAWREMVSQSLEPVFARLYADPLQSLPLTGSAAALAFRIGMLSKGYESIALKYKSTDAEERFLIAVARGALADVPPPNAVAQAISDGFALDAPPDTLARMIASDQLGAAILRAIDMGSEAARGDLDQLADALALFRAVGLEDVARRMALQLMILDHRG